MKLNEDNPIIFIYADGSVVTRANNVTKSFIQLRIGIKRPVLALLPEGLVDFDLVQQIHFGLDPLKGEMKFYPKATLPIDSRTGVLSEA